MSNLPWIRVDIDLKDTPEADRLDAALGERRTWTYVVELWCWAARHAPTGDLSGVETATIARRAGWSGEPEKFVGALISSGFMNASGGLLWWAEQQSKRLERAEQDAERKRAERAEHRQRRGKAPRKPSAGRPQDVRTTSTAGPRTSCVTVRDGYETNTNSPPKPPSTGPRPQFATASDARSGAAYEDRAWSQRLQASSPDSGDAARRATQRLLQERAETERFILLEGLAERAGVEIPPMRGTPGAEAWLAAHPDIVAQAAQILAERRTAA